MIYHGYIVTQRQGPTLTWLGWLPDWTAAHPFSWLNYISFTTSNVTVTFVILIVFFFKFLKLKEKFKNFLNVKEKFKSYVNLIYWLNNFIFIFFWLYFWSLTQMQSSAYASRLYQTTISNKWARSARNRSGRVHERQLHVLGAQLVRLGGGRVPRGVRVAARRARARAGARRAPPRQALLAHQPPHFCSTAWYVTFYFGFTY